MTNERLKTLVAMDDSDVILDAIRAVFERAGFIVKTALNLAQLENHLKDPADVFVLDVQMPEIFGDDVGRVMRDVRAVNVPIFLFSSLDDATLDQRARDAQLTGFVSKHKGVTALLARIKSELATKA